MLLAIIDKSGESKDALRPTTIDDANDFVWLELRRQSTSVVPVLVRSARMPRAEQLPYDLKDFAYRNAVELTHARWKSDVQVLIKALSPHLGNAADSDFLPAERTKRIETETTTGPTVISQTIPAAQADTARMKSVVAPTITGIEAAAAQGVSKELARYIGPISEIVVKRAVRRCSSLAVLCAEVAQEIESKADRDTFLASCKRLQSTFTAPPTS